MVTSKDQGFMLPEGFVDECVEYEEVRPVAMWWRYLLALLVILIIGYLFYFLERTKQRPRNDEVNQLNNICKQQLTITLGDFYIIIT